MRSVAAILLGFLGLIPDTAGAQDALPIRFAYEVVSPLESSAPFSHGPIAETGTTSLLTPLAGWTCLALAPGSPTMIVGQFQQIVPVVCESVSGRVSLTVGCDLTSRVAFDAESFIIDDRQGHAASITLSCSNTPAAPAPSAPMETRRPGGNGGGATLTEAEVQAVVSENSIGLKQACWDRSTTTTTNVTVTAHVVINSSGRVTQATATGNDPLVAHCLEEQIRRWKWPGPGEVNIPYHFVRQ